MNQNLQRLRRAQAGLLVVDVQEKLWPAIDDRERLVQNLVRLIKGCRVLNLPIFVTEQYTKGLGRTIGEVATALGPHHPFEKLTFTSCGAAGLLEALRQTGLEDVLLCGIEAHVCVTQTCLDLIGERFKVFVASDAVSSRSAENRRLGLERMRCAGATMESAEMALFELLGRAGTDEFKQILALVK